MRRPNLNALAAFNAAARGLSFRAAAEDMNVTQGAVAQQVRKLEADLGVELFTRMPRGLALTEAGRRYHKPVAEAFAMIDAATDALSPPIAPAKARVALSAPPSLAAKWLSPRLDAFKAQHPDIDLTVSADERVASFRRGRVDLAIRQGRTPTDEQETTLQLAPLGLVAVAAPSICEEIGEVAQIADLRGRRFIDDGHGWWAMFLPPEEARGMMRFPLTALAMDAAVSGQGVALAPELLVRDDVENGRLSMIWRAPEVDEAYHLVWPKRAHRSPPRDAVRDWLINAVM